MKVVLIILIFSIAGWANDFSKELACFEELSSFDNPVEFKNAIFGSGKLILFQKTPDNRLNILVIEKTPSGTSVRTCGVDSGDFEKVKFNLEGETLEFTPTRSGGNFKNVGRGSGNILDTRCAPAQNTYDVRDLLKEALSPAQEEVKRRALQILKKPKKGMFDDRTVEKKRRALNTCMSIPGEAGREANRLHNAIVAEQANTGNSDRVRAGGGNGANE